MWVLTVWLLRNSRSAISGLVSPWAIRPRISTSRWVRPSGGSGAGADEEADPGPAAGAALDAAASRVARTRGANTVRPPAAGGRVGVFGEVAARAGPQRLDDRAVVGVGGEHDDRDPRMLGDEAAGGADAVEHRHVQVEQDRVGLVLGHQGQGLLAVGGGADHVDAGQPAQQQDPALTNAGLGGGDDK